MSEKSNMQKNFFEILATTPIPLEYAKEMLGDKFEPLQNRMLFIVTSTGIVLPSPLFPGKPLSAAEQKINRNYREIRPLLASLDRGQSAPIDYIPEEERQSTFSALVVCAIRQFNEFNLNVNLSNEKVEERKKRTLNMFKEMFGRHISPEHIEVLDTIFNQSIVREKVNSL